MKPIIRFATIAATLALGAFAACTAAEPDSATIVNSGSTNFTGYTIDVRSDGSATAQTSNRGVDAASTPTPFTVDAATAKQFFADLSAARADNAPAQRCMKSASFGSTTRVTWHDWTSPDLSCPPSDAAWTALVRDVQAITAASGISAGPRRGGGPLRIQPQPEPSQTAS
jgi:hypothetical protein